VKDSFFLFSISDVADYCIIQTFHLSTILNGVCFYVVGKYELGKIMHHFPRHVIVGVIGGFGVFLLGTSVEIATVLWPSKCH
jgi:MFS superfamily sulfate permease-like transporter